MSHQWQYLFLIPILGFNNPPASSLIIPDSQLANQPSIEQISQFEAKNNYCSQEVKSLTKILLQDLPNYGNRVIQRTQNLNREAGISNYIVVAGKGQFEALDLPQIQYDIVTTESNTEQIFFTTLERQYMTTTQSPKTRKIERETYHWLFLTPTDRGWRMVTMFSRFGSSELDNLPTPPQESSNGIIGQAIQLWLKDCRAGTIS